MAIKLQSKGRVNNQMRTFRSLALIAVLAVAVAVAGCSGQAPAGPSTPTASQPTGSGSAKPAAPKVVGISNLARHPALDDLQNGFIQGLKENGFVEGQNIVYKIQNAQNDLTLTKTIADGFVNDKVDLMATITTPNSQAGKKAIQNTKVPMVFFGISDPVAAGLIQAKGKPTGENVTGVYNIDVVAKQVELWKVLFPDLKNIGVIYNPGETNSVAYVKRLKNEYLRQNGWNLVEATVANSNEVQTAAQSLVGRVDMIWQPQDNTVVSALESVIKVANEAKIPFMVGDMNSVKRGAYAGVGNNEFEAGRQAGHLAARILRGEDAGKIPPEELRKSGMWVNSKTAVTIGRPFAEQIKQQAVEVGQ